MKDLARRLALAFRATSPADEVVPPQAAPAAIALLSETIRAHAKRRRLRRSLLAVAALAALLAGGTTTWVLLQSASDGLEVESAHLALLTRGEASEAAARGARLEAGARVATTSGGSVRMRFNTGSEITLEERSSLELLSAGVDQHLRLSAGRLTAEVAHLSPGQRFRIATPDTQLEVRGTRFTVEWSGEAPCAGQAATRVRVEEGIVWVRHGREETEVRGGGVWPLPCPAVTVVPPPALPHPAPTRPPPSRLAEENRRFGEVLQARQAGRPERALELLDALRHDFPRGHLEEDVAAEELRLVAQSDPARARRAARLYLQRFPHGYARALAEELSAAP